MRKGVCALMLLLLPALVVAGGREKLNAQEKKLLQGTWAATETVGFDKAKSGEDLRELRLVIKGDRLSAHYGDKTAEATFRVDASRSPFRLDVTVTKGPKDVQGKTFEGIYVVEGDVLRVAFRDPGKGRRATVPGGARHDQGRPAWTRGRS